MSEGDQIRTIDAWAREVDWILNAEEARLDAGYRHERMAAEERDARPFRDQF